VPGGRRQAGETLFALEVSADGGRVQWEGALGVRIDRALDDAGRLLEPLPASAGLAFYLPGRASVVVNGVPFDPAPDEAEGPAPRLVPVRLREWGRPATRLKELRGHITAEVRTPPQAVVTVDKVLAAAGRTVKGAQGGSVRVLEAARQADGLVRLRVQVEPLPRALSAAAPPSPFNGTVLVNGRPVVGGLLLNSSHFGLLDDKGRPFRVVQALAPSRRGAPAQEYELTYQPEDGQGAAAKFVYRDHRTVILDVPFLLKDVPLPE
jgi:hypothetical protein